jgi:hypothetical protein
MEKLAEEVSNEYNNSLGDKFAHWAGLIDLELGNGRDEPRGGTLRRSRNYRRKTGIKRRLLA